MVEIEEENAASKTRLGLSLPIATKLKNCTLDNQCSRIKDQTRKFSKQENVFHMTWNKGKTWIPELLLSILVMWILLLYLKFILVYFFVWLDEIENARIESKKQ